MDSLQPDPGSFLVQHIGIKLSDATKYCGRSLRELHDLPGILLTTKSIGCLAFS